MPTATKAEADNKAAQAEQDKLAEQAQKDAEANAKNPEKAAQRQHEHTMEQLKSLNLVEDINSMVHPDADDPVQARGSSKAGVPAGSEEIEKAHDKNRAEMKSRQQKGLRSGMVSDRSNDPADKNAAVTVDPDGSKRTKDGVA